MKLTPKVGHVSSTLRVFILSKFTYEHKLAAVRFGITNLRIIYAWQSAADAGQLVAVQNKQGRPSLNKTKKSVPLAADERAGLERPRKQNQALSIENEYLKN